MNSPLKEMLIKQGFIDNFERGVQLWKMFHETYLILKDIAYEIEDNEKQTYVGRDTNSLR